jgi:hypothetical protein
MYIPDWSFVRKLRELNPDLTVRWNNKLERWVIYLKYWGTGRPVVIDGKTIRPIIRKEYMIKVVREADGSYRPLGNLTIMELKWGDTHARGPDCIADQLEKEDEDRLKSESRARLTQSEGLFGEAYNDVFDIQQSGWSPIREKAAI